MDENSSQHLAFAALGLGEGESIVVTRDGDEVVMKVDGPERYVQSRIVCTLKTLMVDHGFDPIAYIVHVLAAEYRESVCN